MTNPSGEFDLDKAFEAHWEQHSSCDKTCFKAGAHYGIGAVIEWLELQDTNPTMYDKKESCGLMPSLVAHELRKRFQSGQASDGGKENEAK